jgi:hypothetical protein
MANVPEKRTSGKSNASRNGDGHRSIKEIEIEIVAQTDVVGFYKNTLGFVIKGSRPNAQGWLPVLGKDASGEDEKKSSAAINVGTDPKLRGRYRNLATDESYRIFEAGAKFGNLGDWKDVRARLAREAGVDMRRYAGGTNGRGKRRPPKQPGRPPDPQASGKRGSPACRGVGAAAAGRPAASAGKGAASAGAAGIPADPIEFYRDELGFTIPGERRDWSGLGFEYDPPDADGWLPVTHKGADGNEVAAAINVGDGPGRGYYRDSKTGETLSPFRAGVKFGRFLNPEHTAAVLANVWKVRPDADPKHRAADAKLDFLRPKVRRSYVEQFCEAKGPITPEAVTMCGGEVAGYPHNVPAHAYQSVIAFPFFSEPRHKPSGYCLVRADGADVSKYEGPDAEPTLTKVLTVMATGAKPGFLNPFALKRLKHAEVVWKVEGLTDMLALQTAIPEELRETHLVITNSNGCAERVSKDYVSLLAGTNAKIYVVGDCDVPGRRGATNWCNALVGKVAEVKDVVLPFEIEPKHGKDVRDYFNDGHTYAELLQIAAAAAPASGRTGNVGGERGNRATSGGGEDGDYAVEVELNQDPHQVAAQVAEALAVRLPALSVVEHIYERNNALATVIDDGRGRLRAVALPKARLVEFLGPRVRLLRDGKPTDKLPDWLRDAVFARQHWDGLPVLSGVVRCPVMRPDGTLLLAPGYDPATRLLLDWRGEPLAVPDSPTKEDATRACDVLLDLVAEFPFEKMAHRSSYVAAVLTPMARPAFRGPAPLYLADAPVRGIGKTKLLSCPVVIATGEMPDPIRYSTDEEELDKRLNAYSGKHVIFFDNVSGKFGGGLLDMVLTSPDGRYDSRVLKQNRIVSVDLSAATWFCTGNNLTLVGDTARRVCYVRLQSSLENPETRGGFRHPDLLAHVKENRPRYLAAALTILRAFHMAGCPGGGLQPAFGSFEGWSALVRAAVVWCGLPDPWETCLQLQSEADVGARAMAALLVYWQKMDRGGKGLTTSGVIDELYDSTPGPLSYYHDMRAAIEDLGCHKNAYKLGYVLRTYRGRFLDGRCIEHAGVEHNSTRWVVKTQAKPEQHDLPLGGMGT